DAAVRLPGAGGAQRAGELGHVEYLRDDRAELLRGGVVRLEELLNRRTDDGAERTLGWRHLHEPDERLGNLGTAWRIGRANDGLERAMNIVHILRGLAVAGHARFISRRDEAIEYRGAIDSRLDQHRIDAEREQLEPVGIRERLERELAGAVRRHRRNGHTAGSGADVNQQAAAPLPHRRENGAIHAHDTEHVDIEHLLELFS